LGGGGEPPGARPGGRPRVSAVGRADRIGSDPARLGPCAAQPSDADPRSDRTLPRPPMPPIGATSDRERPSVVRLCHVLHVAPRARAPIVRPRWRALPLESPKRKKDRDRPRRRPRDHPCEHLRDRRLARRSSAHLCPEGLIRRRASQTLQRARIIRGAEAHNRKPARVRLPRARSSAKPDPAKPADLNPKAVIGPCEDRKRRVLRSLPRGTGASPKL
jgi:hypothetical protein